MEKLKSLWNANLTQHEHIFVIIPIYQNQTKGGGGGGEREREREQWLRHAKSCIPPDQF